MKYTFEASETEVTEFFGLMGLMVREVGKTVRHSNELRHQRGGARLTAVPEPTLESEGKGADVIDFPRPVPAPVRMTEEELEDSIVNEPEPFPKPAKAESPKDPKEERLLKRGGEIFYGFVQDWLVGIDIGTMQLIEGVTQPDRAQMLRDLQNGPHSYAVLRYVKSTGGLQCAIADATGSEDLAVALAPFIVPPASIAFSDLADTYEYVNPFKKSED